MQWKRYHDFILKYIPAYLRILLCIGVNPQVHSNRDAVGSEILECDLPSNIAFFQRKMCQRGAMFPETMIVGERVVAVMSLISWAPSRASVLFCLLVNVIFKKVAESSDTTINHQPSPNWETSTPSSESPPSSIRRFKILPLTSVQR